MTRDTELSINDYAYCGNNPVDRFDLDGESWVRGVIVVAKYAKPAGKAVAKYGKTAGKAVGKAAKKSGKWVQRKASKFTASNRNINFAEKQVQEKFKHAHQFGVKGNYSKANAQTFKKALEDHTKSFSTEAIKGTYRGKEVIHYLDPKTGMNVMTSPKGEFISGWKLEAHQIEHIIKIGKLGGG